MTTSIHLQGISILIFALETGKKIRRESKGLSPFQGPKALKNKGLRQRVQISGTISSPCHGRFDTPSQLLCIIPQGSAFVKSGQEGVRAYRQRGYAKTLFRFPQCRLPVRGPGSRKKRGGFYPLFHLKEQRYHPGFTAPPARPYPCERRGRRNAGLRTRGSPGTPPCPAARLPAGR